MGFEKKEKDKSPKLSQKMIDIIEKSHRDGDGEQYDTIDSYKYIIMKVLTENDDILWTLHNEDLEFKKDKNGNKILDKDGKPILKEKLNGDEYRNVNIYSFLKIPDIQSTVKNFICFEVDDSEDARYSRTIKRNEHLSIIHITFRTVSHEDDYKTDYGIARQDLLAAIIKSEFDWSNIFGIHMRKIYDKGRIAENGYYYREFTYETYTANNLINKAVNGGATYGE